MAYMSRNTLVLFVLLAAGALGILFGCSKSVPASTPASAGAELSDAPLEGGDKYAALGSPTPLEVVTTSLTQEEIRIAALLFTDDARRELVLRGFWLRDRAAESAAEVTPFVRLLEEATDEEKNADIVSLSLAALVRQWYLGAPIEVFAQELEAGALRFLSSEDDVVHLQSAMLLWVMVEDGREYTLSPAARRALREAEQNEAIVHFMDVQRDEVLAEVR